MYVLFPPDMHEVGINQYKKSAPNSKVGN